LKKQAGKRSGRKFLKPGNLTPHIKYIFEEADRTDDKAILINPIFAFGTGTHPTTQLAALLLEEVCANKLVLDIGTGSGILSLAARLSGATKVYSFDNDAMAMKIQRKISSSIMGTTYISGLEISIQLEKTLGLIL